MESMFVAMKRPLLGFSHVALPSQPAQESMSVSFVNTVGGASSNVGKGSRCSILVVAVQVFIESKTPPQDRRLADWQLGGVSSWVASMQTC